FAVHGVGGIIGTIMVSFLALSEFSGPGLSEGMTAYTQLMVQLYGILVTVVWTTVFTLVALGITTIFTPLRV
ncbi:MAG TPA: ammonia channel protein, partial [Proteobacteria bacterium]|nr:ammonia channel protein [Pseudomonadota bacterium]